MGIVSGGGGGGFAGGTITAPLQVSPAVQGTDFVALGVTAATGDRGNLTEGVIRAVGPSNLGAGIGDRLFHGESHDGHELLSVQDDGTMFFQSGNGSGELYVYNQTGAGYWHFNTATGLTYVASGTQFAVSATGVVTAKGAALSPITAGALPTVQLVTATGAQILTTRDAETITPCTFNPGAATTATVTVALSPDNVTYSTLGVVTEPAGVALDGTILLVSVRVPAGWYLKLTVNAQAVLGLTTYY